MGFPPILYIPVDTVKQKMKLIVFDHHDCAFMLKKNTVYKDKISTISEHDDDVTGFNEGCFIAGLLKTHAVQNSFVGFGNIRS